MSEIGLSLNNPGNVRDFGIPWKGMIGVKDGWCQFDTLMNGIRCNVMDVHHIWARSGHTVAGIVKVYAPGADGNDDPAYTAAVEKYMGLTPGEQFDHAQAHVAFMFARGQYIIEIGDKPAMTINDDVIMSGVCAALMAFTH